MSITAAQSYRISEYGYDLYSALRQCVGILCEGGDLNNYRNMTDEELGRAWIAVARNAGMLLNRIDGMPSDYVKLSAPMSAQDAPSEGRDG